MLKAFFKPKVAAVGAGHWEAEEVAGRQAAAEVEDWLHRYTWGACLAVAAEPHQVPCLEERHSHILRKHHIRRQPGRQEALLVARERHQGQCRVQRTRLELHRSRNRHHGAGPREGQRRDRGSRSRHGGCHALAVAKEPRRSQAGRAARASHHGRQGSRRGRDLPQCDEAVRLERHQTVRS